VLSVNLRPKALTEGVVSGALRIRFGQGISDRSIAYSAWVTGKPSKESAAVRE